MSSEKKLLHFCFWLPPSFDFYIVILSSGTHEIFLPDRLKKKLNRAGQPADYSYISAIKINLTKMETQVTLYRMYSVTSRSTKHKD